MLDLVGNPEGRFSRVAAHFIHVRQQDWIKLKPWMTVVGLCLVDGNDFIYITFSILISASEQISFLIQFYVPFKIITPPTKTKF